MDTLNHPLPNTQIRKRLILTDNGHLDWKKMYFKLCRCYPRKEQYSDTLQFCTHCHILFWKVRCVTCWFLSLCPPTLLLQLKAIKSRRKCMCDFSWSSQAGP